MAKKYLVTSPVEHDNKHYPVGGRIELNEAQTTALDVVNAVDLSDVVEVQDDMMGNEHVDTANSVQVTKKYLVTSPIEHDNKRYKVGDRIELNDVQAAALGVVKSVDLSDAVEVQHDERLDMRGIAHAVNEMVDPADAVSVPSAAAEPVEAQPVTKAKP